MSWLTAFHLNNVIAELRLHDLRFADLLGEDGAVKLWHHTTTLRGSEFASRVLAARIVGILFRQFRKVAATLDLLKNVLSLSFGSRICFCVRIRSQFDENMARG